MKSVTLFRHGKSDWSASYGSDHDRPLNKRGIRAAKKMGKFLADKNQVPELIISSTAVRAHTTVQLAIDNAQWKSRLILERGIYGGSPDFLLELIHSQDNIYNSICLVGHEPNFSSFISKATNKNYINFTTANMAKVNFNVDLWTQVQFFNGELEWHQQPKNLELSN
tara:strand:+ start:1890 stop:2390 length:501 start_codon:yes stop_codon:yes gene_type:complete